MQTTSWRSLCADLTYHHNYWNKCESRGPLARQANIHMYNNMFIGQTSYCMNPRANAYIFSEYNLFDSCKNPMEVKLGAVKSYQDVLNGCKGSMDGTVVSDKSQKVNTDCQYANFDTNAAICYIPSGEYFLQTDTSKLASYFEVYGGTMDETKVVNGTTTADQTEQPTEPAEQPTSPAEQPTDTQLPAVTLYGDVDCSGSVDIIDVITLNKNLMIGEEISPQGKANCDVNRSGMPDEADSLNILKYIVELISSLDDIA